MDIAKLLIEKGAFPRGGLSGACEGGHIEIAKLMIEKGVLDIDVDYELVRAIKAHHRDVAKMLIEHGAKLSRYHFDITTQEVAQFLKDNNIDTHDI